MKKTIITTVLLFLFLTVSAQEAAKGSEYNKWSVEANFGINKAIAPFSAGHFTSGLTEFKSFSNFNHFDLGVRYMFNTKFGVKFHYANDKIAETKGSNSAGFSSKQNLIALQGVLNLGRILEFENFTKIFDVLVHGGVQVSKFDFSNATLGNSSEKNGGIILGVTPQVKLGDKFAVTLDYTVITNFRQHYNWDGIASTDSNNLTGKMNTFTLGLSYYIGKSQKHADWFIPSTIVEPNPELVSRLDKIDAAMNDTDRDGVADYLDAQNNTPGGVAVDSKGRYYDVNKNGVPDELEPKEAKDGQDGKNTSLDVAKTLIEKGLVNVFYDLDKDLPNIGSTNDVYHIISFMQTHPDSKVVLDGFADLQGNEKSNLDLSGRRSQKLKDLFMANSIEESRIKITAGGVDKIYKNTDEVSLQLARRVSVSLE